MLFVPSARDEEERRWVLGAVNHFWLFYFIFNIITFPCRKQNNLIKIMLDITNVRRLSMIVRVNVVLNRTVVVDSA